MVGSTLGHYRVLELLGKGGMGEVYLAEDTRLHRRIAVKVLSRDLAGDADRRARLEKEARAVAALNHPNIVTIYSVEEHESTAFLTLELVEGQTLATLIPPPGLALRRLLALAIPIADAVGAAHHRGITHRDLKPSNVMVSDEGRVKVLDFGLARVTQAARNASLASMSTATVTTDGHIAGTAAYMSPEQAEGRPVDSRSDVFSLGIVLYEMATGQRPFKGATPVSLMSAILKDTPPPITELRGDLPADLARIIRRSLEKDPERRYQTAKDLRNDLRALEENTASAFSQAIIHAADTSSAKRRRLVLIGTVGAVLVAGAIGAAVLWQSKIGIPAREPRIPFASITVKSLSTTDGPALSPDGRLIAFSEFDRRTSQYRLWIREVDGPGLSQISHSGEPIEGGLQFAPDGSHLYYRGTRKNAAGQSLHRVSTVGASSQVVFEGVVAKPAFSADSARMALLTRGTDPGELVIVIADADGRNPRRVPRAPNQARYGGAIAWSADGRWLAATRELSRRTEEIAIIDPQSGEERALSRQWAGITGLAWAPDGRSLLVSASEQTPEPLPQIWSVSYPSGEARRITSGQGQHVGISLSRDGRALVTTFFLQRSDIWVAPVGEAVEGIAMPTQGGRLNPAVKVVAWAGDDRLVFSEVVNGNLDIWSTNPDGTARLRLTNAPEDEYGPSVHLESRTVVYTARSSDGTTSSVWRVDLDGRNARRLADGDYAVVSADGKAVYYLSKNNVARRISIDGADDTVVYDPAAAGSGWPAKLPRSGQYPQPSPDGRWVAVPEPVPNAAGPVALVPLSRGEATRHYPAIMTSRFAWTADGRGILYWRHERSGPGAFSPGMGTVNTALTTIWLQPAAGGEPRNLGGFSGPQAMAMSLSPDGKRIAVHRTIFTVDTLLITDGQK
jgi:serine/threonine protein kinase/Tol biopolymer transport system component